MYKEALRGIEGLELGPVIAVVIFFTFFIGLFIYVVGFKKSHTDKMENLPLNDQTISKNVSEENKNL